MKLVKRFDKQFSEIVTIIQQARYNTIKNVNTELVKLYWNVGGYISKKIETAEWGDAVVDQLADYIQNHHPEFKGFTRRGLYRMRQFYEVYRDNEFVSTLLTQISWSCHLHILSKTKTIEEKEFYIRLAVKERYSVRELERQIESGYFERVMISKKKLPSLAIQPHKNIDDDEVVKYAMSRNLSPALVAEYKTKLIPRKILQKKLHELFLLQNREVDGK
jgi:predicted nuclease of restriction endonuclease-like (RecB) superfamily